MNRRKFLNFTSLFVFGGSLAFLGSRKFILYGECNQPAGRDFDSDNHAWQDIGGYERLIEEMKATGDLESCSYLRNDTAHQWMYVFRNKSSWQLWEKRIAEGRLFSEENLLEGYTLEMYAGSGLGDLFSRKFIGKKLS